MRRAANRDKIEPEIIAALEAHGAYVVRINQDKLPDLCVGYLGVWVWMEVKSWPAAQKKGQLRETQKAFHERAELDGLPCVIVRSIKDALGVLEDYCG